MTSFFDKLNLRPHERRLVVVVGLIIFVLLNWWFVWPYFNDWGQTQSEIQRNRAMLERYQREIGNRQKYEARQKELETTGSEMLPSEIDLQRVIQSQAAASGVQLGGMNSLKGQGVKTNQFFQEGGVSIQFTAGGKELVDFLVGIAAQNAMIRVRDMNMGHRENQTKLGGSMVFVGNFQQRPATNAPSRATALSAATQPQKK
jgi:type II secretory pathway component PulM